MFYQETVYSLEMEGAGLMLIDKQNKYYPIMLGITFHLRLLSVVMCPGSSKSENVRKSHIKGTKRCHFVATGTHWYHFP